MMPKLDIYFEKEKELNLAEFSEWAYDFNLNEFKLKNGYMYKVYKDEALKIWITKALLTKRGIYEAYSKDYGSDIEELIGLTSSRDILRSEVKRLIKECLLANPYIKDVNNFNISFEGTKASVAFKVTSIYGEFEITDIGGVLIEQL